MKGRIEIKAKYGSRPLNFKRHTSYVDYPHISVILKNPDNGNIDASRYVFLIDTGASMSILNNSCKEFIKDLTPIDEIYIVYGAGGTQKCPVYNLIFIMNGQEIELKAAFDSRCHYLVLGHYDFLEKNTYNLFDSTLKRTHLIRN